MLVRFHLLQSLSPDVTHTAGESDAQPAVVGIFVAVSPLESDLPLQSRPPPPHCPRQGPLAVVLLSVFEIGIKDRGYPVQNVGLSILAS